MLLAMSVHSQVVINYLTAVIIQRYRRPTQVNLIIAVVVGNDTCA